MLPPLRPRTNILEKNYDVRVSVAPLEEATTARSKQGLTWLDLPERPQGTHRIVLDNRLDPEHGVLRGRILPAFHNRPDIKDLKIGLAMACTRQTPLPVIGQAFQRCVEAQAAGLGPED
jgi:3-hydroxyisobutyrate dehydrogenase-like beta-hydroxyacid dehydrogenase